MGAGQSKPRMLCCAAPKDRKKSSGPRPEKQGTRKTPIVAEALVFTTQQQELRFEQDGAVVIREDPAPEPEPDPSSPGPSGDGHSSSTAKKKVPSGGTGSKLGSKRARPGPPGGAGNRYRMATSSSSMRRGDHFAEFTLLQAQGNMTLGVAQLDYSTTRVLPPGEPRGEGAEGWGLSTRSGYLSFRGKVSQWSGLQPIKEGDRVGMLLDLEKGTLSVFLNDKHLGFMVKAGIVGPVRWMVELNTPGDSVRVSNS